MKRHGFTLIELLVVIAILGLLAAVLFPVFAKVRENGRRTACLSNERQIGMAVMQYATDHDDIYPHRQTPLIPNAHNGGAVWTYETFPYVKNTEVYHCPDDPTPESFVMPSVERHYYADSYGLNSNLAGSRPGEEKTQVIVSAVTAPARTALIFEVVGDTTLLTAFVNPLLNCSASGNGGTDVDGRDPESKGNYAVGCEPYASPSGWKVNGVVPYATGDIGGRALEDWDVVNEPRHGGGANYVACDGHAVWLRPEQVSGGFSQPATGSPCGQDDTAAGCGGKATAAGTANSKYALTFSIH